MSFRNRYAFTKEFLILNAEETSIHYPREKHIIAEYKKLFEEKEAIEKEFDILIYVKKRWLFTTIQIKLLRHKLDKKQRQLHSVEESSVLHDLIEREQKRREKMMREDEQMLEEKKAKEAEQILSSTSFVTHDDDYFDKLWQSNREEFWEQVKLEWRAQNPGKTETDSGIPFEKRCGYLSWMLSIASKGWTIKQMRAELLSTNKKNAQTMCVFDVIDRYDYYFPMIK